MAGKSLHVTKRLVDQAPRSKGPMTARAMINVDGSPPLFLGAGMIVAGAVLYQLRNSRPYITKDFDIVLSCIAIFAGGILVFQVGVRQCHHVEIGSIKRPCTCTLTVNLLF